MRDFYHSFIVTPLLHPQVITADKKSQVFNWFKERGEQVVFLISIGSNEELREEKTVTFILEHSETSEADSFKPVSLNEVLLSPPLVKKFQEVGEGKFLTLKQNLSEVIKARYVGPKPYLRISICLRGEHENGTPLAISALSAPLSFSPFH